MGEGLRILSLISLTCRPVCRMVVRNSTNRSNNMRTLEPAIDERDRAILRLLQEDGRLTNMELAQRINLSPSACLRRVKLLEEAGLISRYVMLLDEKAAGLPGTAFVLVTLDQQGRAALDAFEAAIQQHAEVTECCLLAGAADYMVRVAYADSADFERIHTEILTQLPGVVRVQSTLALRTVKKTTALPV
jgi:Lrp/AsnC family transcriptional regulator, leucine-responsive regulatory protein